LTVTDIDSVHSRGAPLKQAICESARAGPKVRNRQIFDVDFEDIKGVIEFLATTAHELRGGFE
jgi:hypothetical protein